MSTNGNSADKRGEGVSRRNFMKTAAAGAGAAATFGTTAAMASTEAKGNEPAIARPTSMEEFRDAPVIDFAFPARGSDVFAKACKDEGLAAMFCCPGNYGIVTSIANQGIPTYGGRLEGPMTSAADAFIRVTGEVAAASGTEGPGFTNMIVGIAAANAARTPLLVLASNMSLAGDDTESRIQRGYQQPTTEGLKKYGKRLVTPNRVHEYAAYAFRHLKSGVPGPVHLDFVSEVAYEQFESPMDLELYVDKSKYRTDSKPHPDPKDIDKAVELIKQSKRPMIVASTGVFYNHACDVLKEFAEKTQIPVTESGPMRGKFSDTHPLSANRAPDSYPSVDLVIMIGQYCMPAVGEFAFGPDAKIVRIDPCAEDMGRNMPTDLGIISDEKAAIEALLEKTPAANRDAWIAEVRAAEEAFDAQIEEWYQLGLGYSTDGAIHPAVIARELGDFLYRGDIPPEQTTVVSGGFGIGKWTRRELKAMRPGQICNGPYQYGAIGPDVGYTVGCGVAMELGAGYQKGYEGAPVVCVTGDAGFAYSGMEIDTLAKYRIPAVIVVYNNNAWGTWAGAARYPRVAHVHQFQENLRYHKLAEALGGHGEYVTAADEMKPALERAWKVAVDERRPSVINCQAKKEFWIGADYPPGMTRGVEPGCEAYNH